MSCLVDLVLKHVFCSMRAASSTHTLFIELCVCLCVCVCVVCWLRFALRNHGAT